MNSSLKRVLAAAAVVVLLGWLWSRVRSSAPIGAEVEDHSKADSPSERIYCVGRAEPASGEVELAAQMQGTLEAVSVTEGQTVQAGAVLALVYAPREKALVTLAEARLARVLAGTGREEIAAADAARASLAAQLDLAETELKRAQQLKEKDVIADQYFDERRQHVATLRNQVVSAQKRLEALERGPLPEDVAVARAEVAAAEVAYKLHEVRAPIDGIVVNLYRHAGDQVLLNYPTPILRLADTNHLQIRVELNEADIYWVGPGTQGKFTVLGTEGPVSILRIRTALPSFGPRRLFDPDTSVQVDARTSQVLCDIVEATRRVYPGQRVTVEFPRNHPP